VNPPKPYYLCNRGELRAVVDARKRELAAEIAALEEDYLLKADANKLCRYFCGKYAIEVPTLSEQEPEVIDRSEIKLSATGYERIPFA
jgi:hypothetical protein